MLTETPTKNGQVDASALQREPAEDAAVREVAARRLERIRKFKLHLAVFAVGMPFLTGVWALTEYLNADGWPERFSESAGEGNWNPWIVWVFLIWGGLLAIDAVRTYLGGPPTEAEIDREVERLRARR
ncbi:MAG TPA: 2TM domain-containing protein [Gaiellaceae bacterium]|jgi:hypothetical protein|nr:2TM domain-containing protein [Gaiellaceae bacterium]